MIEFLTTVGNETARIFYEGSLYILLGFLVAGLLHEFLPTEAIARHLGRESPRSVILAALFGAPIPLCSCGVLPAAAALRKKGASRSSLLSFLISTPETGVDSIALTYGLMGPVMAVVRPIVAIVTAVIAGVLSIVMPQDETAEGAGAELEGIGVHTHGEGELPRPSHASWTERTRRVGTYGFGTLLDEIAFWLVVGIVLTGFLAALIPDDFFSSVLGWERGLLPMIVMIVAGLPLYLCASASTPVAAALVLKGLSPGAALVFLLVGPATNAATMTVVGRILGYRRLRVYLGSLVLVSLAAGTLLDTFAADAVRATTLAGGPERDPWSLATLKTAAALAFVAMLLASFHRTRFREGIADVRDQAVRLASAARDFDPRSLLSPPLVAAVAAVLVLAWLPSFVLVVEPGQRGIVQRFGRVVGTELEPGLHLHLPAPLGRGRAVAVERVRQIPVGYRGSAAGRRDGIAEQSFYLTADENIIDIRSVVHYRVDDPVRFALGVEAAADVIRAVTRRELVAIISKTPIDTLYTTARDETEAAFKLALGRRIDALDIGCEILDARLLDVHAPADVHDAFREIASALEDREREILVAAGYAAERQAEAVGEAAAVIDRARAEGARAVKLARGNAAAFSGIAREHVRHPRLTEIRLYLEALEKALPEPRKYVHGVGRGGDVDLWLGSGRSLPELVRPSENDGRRSPGETAGNDTNTNDNGEGR